MTRPDRWQRIQSLFDAALEQPPGTRDAWLAEATDDAEIRREVQRMVAAHERADGILEAPIHAYAAHWIAQAEAQAHVGRTVGPYELLDEIGRGGMGVVYKAHDARLGRFVAIKFLPTHLHADAEAKARFLGEARAASQLDHANICVIHDLGETVDGRQYIVMAHCEGQTLQERIQAKPLPLAEALDIAIQTAEGLARAHAADIVHRDIKPSNLIVSPEGVVKILDFGVAKLGGRAQGTSPGTLIGTVSYMSPEQVRGKLVDGRSDLWSLGVLLYEMVTGRRPFQGEPDAVLLHAILEAPMPDARALRPDLPPSLDRILRRTLARNLDERYRNADDLIADLKALRDGEPAGVRAPRAARARPGDLPTPVSSFVGRDAELHRLSDVLGTVRLLTLTGPGGTGKSRLALEAASRAAASFPDGVFLVPLGSITDPDLVAPTIAQSLDVPHGPATPALDALMHGIARKRMLLVLDNFEQVASAAPRVGALLEACPHLTALVTSRVRLRLSGEQELAVVPLELPDLDAIDPGTDLLRFSAIHLFVDRARAAHSDFELTETNRVHVATLCVRLDGLPLAIELAAARTRLFSPQALLRRLERRLDLLKGGPQDHPTRHQTLRQAIAWSYDLLTADEKALFCRLGVFLGGFTLEASAAVAAARPALEMDVVDGVSSLADQSLLQQQTAPDGEPRFHLLETIREFALELLRESDVEEATRRAHMEHVLALAERAEPELTGPDQARWLDRLETEHDNVRTALAWAWTTDAATEMLRLGAALWRFWLARGHVDEGREQLERALTLAGTAPPLEVRARALNGVGTLSHNAGRNRQAQAFLQECLAIYRDTGDEAGVVTVLNNLAWVACELNDLRTGEVLGQEALEFNRRLGQTRGIAVALNNLGWVAIYRADHRAASRYHEASLQLRRELGDQRNVAFALTNLAWAARIRGDFQRAQELLSESSAILQEIGDKLLLCNTWVSRGITAHEMGELDRALEILDRGTAFWREPGNRSLTAFAFTFLSAVEIDREQPDRAQSLLEEADIEWRACGMIWGSATATFHRGRLASLQGDPTRARQFHGEALDARFTIGDRRGIADSLEAIAAIDAQQGELDTAVRACAAAAHLRETAELPIPPVWRSSHENVVDRLRRELGPVEFARLWDEGGSTPLESIARR